MTNPAPAAAQGRALLILLSWVGGGVDRDARVTRLTKGPPFPKRGGELCLYSEVLVRRSERQLVSTKGGGGGDRRTVPPFRRVAGRWFVGMSHPSRGLAPTCL